MSTCENCSKEFSGPGVSYGRFCGRRCYHTAWMRARRHADPQAYREEMRRRREDPEFAARQRASRLASDARRRAEKIAEQERYASANPEKVGAKHAVRRAVARGELDREPCLFCEAPKTHAHHHDYSQPLAVTWLCPRHHGLVHRKNEGVTHVG